MAAREPKKKAPRQTAAQKHAAKRTLFLVDIMPKLQFDEKPMFHSDLVGSSAEPCVEIALGCSLVEGTSAMLFGYPTTSDFYAESQALGIRIDKLNLESWGYAHGCTAIFPVASVAYDRGFRISRNTPVPGVETPPIFAVANMLGMIGTAWVSWTGEYAEFIVTYDNQTMSTAPCVQRMTFRDSSLLCHQSELHIIATIPRSINEAFENALGNLTDLVHTETLTYAQWSALLRENGVLSERLVVVHHPEHWKVPLGVVDGDGVATAAAAAGTPRPSPRDELEMALKRREVSETLNVSDGVADSMKEYMFPIPLPSRLRMQLRQRIENGTAVASTTSGEPRILLANTSMSAVLKSEATTVDDQLDFAVVCCDSFKTASGTESAAMRLAFPSDYCVPGGRDNVPTEARLGTWSSAVVREGATVVINLFTLVGSQLSLKALRIGTERLAGGLRELVGDGNLKYVTMAMCQRAGTKQAVQTAVCDALCCAFWGTGITIKLFATC